MRRRRGHTMLDVLIAVMLIVIIRMTRRSIRSSSPSASSMTHCSMSFWALGQPMRCDVSEERPHRLVRPFFAVLLHETEALLNDRLQVSRASLDAAVNFSEQAYCRSKPRVSASADRQGMIHWIHVRL